MTLEELESLSNDELAELVRRGLRKASVIRGSQDRKYPFILVGIKGGIILRFDLSTIMVKTSVGTLQEPEIEIN